MKIVKYLVLTAVCFSVISCSRANPEVAIAPPENVNVASKESFDAQAAQLSLANETQTPQSEAPDTLIKDLYRVHDQDLKNGGVSNGIINSKSRTLLDKYFDKNLAGLIWKDLTTHKNEIGVIDFDVFYNTQDPNIKNLSVGQAKIEGAKATVTVSFTNSGAKGSVTYSLARQNGAWKIADIKYTEGSLLGYFKEDAKNNTADTASEQGSFEGVFQVGSATCTVKPVDAAFELKWAKGAGTMLFFYDGKGVLKYSSEDKGQGADVFVFDDTSFRSGKFIRADGREMAVKKIK